MTTPARWRAHGRLWAAGLILALLAIPASTLLPTDCDGLPGFDDNDGDSDSLAVALSFPAAALPPMSAQPGLCRVGAPLTAAIDVRLPDSAPPRLQPSRSPPQA